MSNWLKLICLALMCTLLGASPAIAEGDTLVAGIIQPPKTLDPHTTSDAQVFNAALQFGETLVRLAPSGEAAPLFAEAATAKASKWR